MCEGTSGLTSQEAAANARMMAASIEMYKALKVARLFLANSIPTAEISGPKPLPIIEAALAKAEGRTP